MENTIPSRLKAARKKANITQKDLGIKIGLEESSASARMNHYEKGRHVPDIGTLSRMAEQLGVPLNYFFCKDDTTAELVCLIDKLINEEKQGLLEKLSSKK